MTSYIPPEYYFTNINYNPAFFATPNDGLDINFLNQRFLRRVGTNPTSIATTTTFNNDLTVGGLSTLNNTQLILSTMTLNSSRIDQDYFGNLQFGENTLSNANSNNNANMAFGRNSQNNTSNSSNNVSVGYEIMNNLNGGSDNTAIGNFSLGELVSGNYNIGIGSSALYRSITGNYNIGIGYRTLFNITNATDNDNNIAIGSDAMYSSFDSIENVCMGYKSGYNTNGRENTFIGTNAGYNNTASYNTCLGSGANINAGVEYSTAIGYGANISAGVNYSTAIGYGAVCNDSNQLVLGGDNGSGQYPEVLIGGNLGVSETTNLHDTNIDILSTLYINGRLEQDYYDNLQYGEGTLSNAISNNTANIAIGGNSQNNTTDSNYNISLGYEIMNNLNGASNNIGIGSFSLQELTTGNRNTCLGYQAGTYLDDDNDNTFVGYNACLLFNDGNFNTGLGSNISIPSGASNSTVIGYNATCTASHQLVLGGDDGDGQYPVVIAQGGFLYAKPSSGNNNVSYGNNALSTDNITVTATGIDNCAFGDSTLRNTTTGSYNTAIGFESLLSNTTGNNNTALGYASLNNNISGVENTSIGYNSSTNLTTGSFNTCVGHGSGNTNNGNYNTFIGKSTRCDSSGYEFSTAIGYNAMITDSNQIQLGGDNGTGVYPRVVTQGGITSTNTINITDTTSSSSISTGALTVSGGIGVDENIYAGNKVNVPTLEIAGTGTNVDSGIKCVWNNFAKLSSSGLGGYTNTNVGDFVANTGVRFNFNLTGSTTPTNCKTVKYRVTMNFWDATTFGGQTEVILDFYPYRWTQGVITGTALYNINNKINGNQSYNYTNATYAPNGRQFWTYNHVFTGLAGPNALFVPSNNAWDLFFCIPSNTYYYSWCIEALDTTDANNNGYSVSLELI